MITLPVTLTVQDLADYQIFSFRHFYQEPVGWRRIPYILIWLILCGMLLLIFSTFSPLRDIQSEAQKKDILHLLSQKIRNVQIKNQAGKMA
ncbi:TPA: hypothetical protein QHM50_001009 [Morganella morganii subsp. morganii]|nr:hypothetical protein [Morganella morganii subsp. morganii]